jgi:hypothetical protein
MVGSLPIGGGGGGIPDAGVAPCSAIRRRISLGLMS